MLTVVAWAALVGCLVATALLVLAHRRIGRLERAHTARKWDIVALRAELGAVRRAGVAGVTGDRSGTAGDRPAAGDRPGEPVDGAEPGTAGAAPAAGEHPADPRRRSGPTAWRRAHRPAGRGRRRPYRDPGGA